MKKLTKRQQQNIQLIQEEAVSIKEAITILKKTATAKFVETAEVHVSLNIDPKYGDQQLRTTLILPKGTGKTKRVAVVSSEDKITQEQRDLADVIGSEDLIETITKGIIDFDILIATPEMMPKLAKLGKVLGPKGLMPSPKAGTVSTDVIEALNEFKSGKIEYRADKTGIVHLIFGKINFSSDDLEQNLISIYNSIEQNRPSGVKGKYFKNLYICTTMGPSIKVDLLSFKN
jgi:large subunit ribosomal protein L1